MKTTSLMASMFVLALAGAAQAGGQPGSIGVGAEVQINGAGGASLNYDAGDFHAGGFFGFHDPGDDDDDQFVIGGRFFYHVHSTAMSDFSVGGTLGVVSQNNPAPDDRQTLLFIEPSFQVRVFVAANVALSFNSGIVIGVMDAEQVDVGGQLTAGAGFHYYFF